MVRQQSSEGVELNVTAMLDMAFQLLAFFILTFRPGPFEPAVKLHMPSTQAAAIGEGPPPVTERIGQSPFKPADINTLRINLFSTSGGLDRMTINDLPAETFEVLRDKMHTMLTNPGSPIEQVIVQASEGLQYHEVMKIVGICLENKLPKTGEFVKLRLVAMADPPER